MDVQRLGLFSSMLGSCYFEKTSERKKKKKAQILDAKDFSKNKKVGSVPNSG